MRTRGFTLIEVMVALAIFAFAAVMLTKIAMQYTQATAHAMLRTKAQFVAQNEIALMQIQQQWLEGTQSKQVTQHGETWQIDQTAETTISPQVQKIHVQVSLYDTEQAKVGASITQLTFFNQQVQQNATP